MKKFYLLAAILLFVLPMAAIAQNPGGRSMFVTGGMHVNEQSLELSAGYERFLAAGWSVCGSIHYLQELQKEIVGVYTENTDVLLEAGGRKYFSLRRVPKLFPFVGVGMTAGRENTREVGSRGTGIGETHIQEGWYFNWGGTAVAGLEYSLFRSLSVSCMVRYRYDGWHQFVLGAGVKYHWY